MAISPPETNPPLIVYADRVLTAPLALQRFEAISRWHPQILDPHCTIEQTQLSQCRDLNVCRQTPAAPAIPDHGRFAVMKAHDHVAT
jgi:hypothetical protein